MDKKASFIFLDIETTGLDPRTHSMIELAAIATDEQFEVIGKPFTALIKDKEVVWDTYCILMHTENGLVKALRDTPTKTTAEAAEQFYIWLRDLVNAENKPQLAGASVHFDVSFLEASGVFGFVKGWTHYRRFDVSTLRTAAKGVGKTEDFRVGKRDAVGAETHRALFDIYQDIDHARKFAKILAAG